MVVHEEDQYGNIETGDNSTVDPASLSDQVGLLLGTTTVTVADGVATFTDLSTKTAGTMMLAFNSAGLTGASSNTIVISPAAASQIVIQTQASSTATAGVPFGTQPVIAEEDQYGNLETGDNSTQVTVSLASGTGPLKGTTKVTVAGGIATFAGLYDDTAETISLNFSGGGFTAGPSTDIAVMAAAASQLIVQAQPSSSRGGRPAAERPARDRGKGPVRQPRDRRTSTVITAKLATGSGPLVGATAKMAKGVATFTGLADDKADDVARLLRRRSDGPPPRRASPSARRRRRSWWSRRSPRRRRRPANRSRPSR